MFVSKRKIRRVILGAINNHVNLAIPDDSDETKRDAFMYQCGELSMATYILKELKVSGRRLKGESYGESSSKRSNSREA